MTTETLTREETRARLLAAHNPIILIHRKPDGDALGSAVALAHFYLARGEMVSIDCADPIPQRIAFLQEGLTLIPADEGEGRTVITLDVASPAQLGNIADKYITDSTPHLMIDHHSMGIPFAPHYIVPDESSTGEVLYDLFASPSLDPAVETGAVAEALYAAISSDTGCFRYSNVTPKTLRIAAALLEKQIDAGHINHLLYDSKPLAQIKAEGLALANMRTAENGRIAYATFTYAELTAIGDEHFETAIDVVRALKGAEIALTLKETEDGNVRGSLRSTGADIASVAAHFGGGGHVRSAGFILKNTTLADAVSLVIPTLIEKLQ